MITWAITNQLACSPRPGAASLPAQAAEVNAWLKKVKGMGIRSIICLLSTQELYECYLFAGMDLLKLYNEAGMEVAHYPITDSLTRRQESEILPEIGKFYDRAPKACLVHCNAGINRTGTVIKHLRRHHAHPSPG